MTPDELARAEAELEAATVLSDLLWEAKEKVGDAYYAAIKRTDRLRLELAKERERQQWRKEFEAEAAAVGGCPNTSTQEAVVAYRALSSVIDKVLPPA